MTESGAPIPASADSPPAASLIAIPVRGKAGKSPAASPGQKRGDLTQHLSALAERAGPKPPLSTTVMEPTPEAAVVADGPPPLGIVQNDPPSPESESAATDAQVPASGPALTIVRNEPPATLEPPDAAMSQPDAEPVAAKAAPATPNVPEFTDVTAYWRQLCGASEYPAVAAVDRELVARNWPGSLLIAFARSADYPRRDPSIGGVTRLGAASAAMQEAIDNGSYAIEWMIDVGRAALAAAAPLEELQRLSTSVGSVAFRLVALPLGTPHAEPDTVLCQLAPATAAPRFGKRRNWLAA